MVAQAKSPASCVGTIRVGKVRDGGGRIAQPAIVRDCFGGWEAHCLAEKLPISFEVHHSCSVALGQLSPCLRVWTTEPILVRHVPIEKSIEAPSESLEGSLQTVFSQIFLSDGGEDMTSLCY